MRELKRLVAVLLYAWAIFHPGRAHAQNAAPIELKWSALESCPSADAVLARVRKIAGTTRPTTNTLRADAAVTQSGDGLFRLRLEIRYGNLAAVRTIDGKSCKDLAGAAAVALALLLSSEEPLSQRDLAGTSALSAQAGTSSTSSDSRATDGTEKTDEQAATQKAPAVSAQPSQPNARTPRTGSEGGPPRRWHVLLAPLASISVGPMKRLSRGLGIATGVSFDGWRFLAEGRLWASQHETLSNLADAYDVELNRFTVGTRGCRVIWGARFEFAPCALISVHHLSVKGSGPNLVSSGSDSATWPALGVGARGRALITPWLGIVAAVDGELEFARPEVSVSIPTAGSPEPTPVPIVHLAPAAATLSLGVEWIF